jgi:hypothetical protein
MFCVQPKGGTVMENDVYEVTDEIQVHIKRPRRFGEYYALEKAIGKLMDEYEKFYGKKWRPSA